MTPSAPPDTLPPSATLVLRVLNEADTPLTRYELERECGLPERTTRYALERLRDTGTVTRADNPDVPATKPRYSIGWG